jgi:hypothetical protein
MPRRAVERFEFDPEDPDQIGAVVDRMVRLAAAADGWINLLPGIPEEAAPEAPSGLFPMFSPRYPGATMATWFPPHPGRGTRDVQTVGVTHSVGARVRPGLAEVGLDVPEGWRLVQDHPRRGLIVAAPAGADHAEVLGWALYVTATVSSLPMTGRWRADVYQPLG